MIFGASGSGKSTLMEQLQLAGSQYSIHVKGTDTAPRQYDGIEIRCVSSVDAAEFDYIYQTYGFRYGIQRVKIDEALAANRHHFIICNDLDVIRSLKRDYPRVVRVVFHHFDAPRDILRSIQTARGINDDEIELRLAKTEALYKSFVEHRELFDDIFHNHYGDDPEESRSKMERLLYRLAAQRSPSGAATDSRLEQFVRELEVRLTSPMSSAPNTFERDYVFIVMAMVDDHPELEDSHLAIKRSCERLKLRAQRVDDIVLVGTITEKVLAHIELAEFVIADFTLERPNVYYEIGYADALDKQIVLLARQGTKVHFDLQGQRVHFYRNISDLERILARTIPSLSRQPADRA